MASFDGNIKINTKIDQSGVDKGLSEMTSSCTSFVSTVGAIFAGIGAFEFGKSALKSTADIELAQVKLETLLGSADRAQAMIADIVKMADTTPYNSNDLIEAATTLKTFGISASEIMPTLTALGNAAGGQADKLKGVAMALGQTAAQGKMMTQDLYQFINAGVPLLDLLAKRLNKSKGEIKGMIEEGKIGYAEVNGALQEFYTGNGKYAGLMAKAAQTLPGMWSSFQDSVTSLGRSLVSSLEPALKSLIGALTQIFQAMAKWITENKSLVETAIKMAGVVLVVAGALYTAAKAAAAFRVAVAAVNMIMYANPIGLIVAAIAVMVGWIYIAIDKYNEFGAVILTLLGPVGMLAGQVKQLSEHWDKIKESFTAGGMVKGMIEIGKAIVDNLVYPLQQLFQMMSGIPKFGKYFKEAADGLQKFREKYLSASKTAAKPIKGTIGGGDERPDAKAAADKAALAKQQKLWSDYYAWKIGEVEGSLSEEIAIINTKYAEESALYAAGSMEQAALEERRGADVLAAREKWGERHKLAAFLMGRGYSESEASGIESGVHFVTHAVKETFEAIAQTAAVMGEIFSGAINLADWMVAFDPATLYDDFKKYIEGLADFFENDLGSIPIFFDQGVAIFEKFLAGMIANLPAIVETLGAVIDKIVGYIATNAGTIIDQVLTIVVALAQVIISKLPSIFAAAFQAVVSLLGKIAEVAPDLIKTLFDAVGQMIAYIGQHAGELIKALIDALVSVFIGVAKNIDKLIEPLAEAAPEIAYAITVNVPEELIKNSPAIIAALVVGIIKSIPALIKGLASGFYNVGKSIIQGIIKGILALGDLWGAVKRVFTSFVNAVLGFFGIHSPSTLFAEIGVNIILGLVNGILSLATGLYDAFMSIFSPVMDFGGKIVSSIIGGITGAASGIGKALWSVLSDALDFIGGLGEAFLNFGKNLATSIVDGIKSGLSSLGDLLGGGSDGWFGDGGNDWYDPGDWFANGTDSAPGGMAVVGERGPELVNLPKGSSVLTASKTMALLSALNNFSGAGMAASSGGGSFSFDISAADVKIDGDMVGQVVFKRIDKIVRNAYGVRP